MANLKPCTNVLRKWKPFLVDCGDMLEFVLILDVWNGVFEKWALSISMKNWFRSESKWNRPYHWIFSGKKIEFLFSRQAVPKLVSAGKELEQSFPLADNHLLYTCPISVDNLYTSFWQKILTCFFHMKALQSRWALCRTRSHGTE